MKSFRIYPAQVWKETHRLSMEQTGVWFMKKVMAAINEPEPTKPESKRLRNVAWLELRERVFRAQGKRCKYCGLAKKPMSCDHVVPLARGGSNDESNLVPCCLDCNRSKGTKLLSEWKRD